MKEKKEEKKEEINLTPEEVAAIETQRMEVKNLEEFRVGYENLVKKTGFTWVVDSNSTLNNIQLGIARAKQQ